MQTVCETIKLHNAQSVVWMLQRPGYAKDISFVILLVMHFQKDYIKEAACFDWIIEKRRW